MNTPARTEPRHAQRTSIALEEVSNRVDRIHVLAIVYALVLTFYLAVEPTQNWILLLLTALTAMGTDAIVRHHPEARFEHIDDTALYLFVPVLFALAAGTFLEDVSSGYISVLLGLASVFPFWLILRAEYESVDRDSETYAASRLLLNGATYVVAFLFFAVIYEFDLSLLESSFAAGIVSVLLAIEVLREEGLDTTHTIFYAAAIGFLLGEAAWSTHFLPLDASASAVFLLLAFYLLTGLMHNYLGDRLNRRTVSEFSAVAFAGIAIIALSQAT